MTNISPILQMCGGTDVAVDVSDQRDFQNTPEWTASATLAYMTTDFMAPVA